MPLRSRTDHPGKAADARPPFLARRWALVLAALFLAALLWRLAYLSRLAASPLSGSLRADERDYWEWATVLLDHRFRGSQPFFLGPLYPYVLALVRSVVGPDVSRVLIVQAVWGALAVALLADAARRLTRPSVALGLGLVMALYEMSVFFDGLILMESLLFLLDSLLLWLWCAASKPPGRTLLFVAIALVTGLIAQGRAVGALLLVPGMLLAARSARTSRRLALGRIGAVAATFLLTVLPSVAWNWSACHEVIPYTYNFGYNLYIGNNPEASGGPVSALGGQRISSMKAAHADGGVEGDGREFLKKARGLELTPAQSSSYWARQAAAYVRREPGTALALAGRKLLMLWNRRETPQLENSDLYRRLAGPLGLPVAGTFLCVALVGIAGWAAAGSRPGMGVALRLYPVLLTAGTLPFFVTDRYRFHLVPGLALLGAVAIEDLLRCRSVRPARSVRVMVASAMTATVVAMAPVPGRDLGLEEMQMDLDLGARWLERGLPDRALPCFERAIAIERSRGLSRDPDPAVIETRAQLYFNLGAALRHLGRTSEAMDWLRAAAEAQPNNSRFVRTLGDAYRVQGREREGDSLLRRVDSLVSGASEAMLSEGYRAAREGRLEQAEDLFRRAAEGDALLYGAWAALIRVQVQRDELPRAGETLVRAAAAGMPPPMLRVHQALVAAAAGDSAGAHRALAGVPEDLIERDPTLARVVALTRKLLARPR